MNDDEERIPWHVRLMCLNRWTFWAGAWLGVGHMKLIGCYDTLMLRFWPYDRWPGEWKDLVSGPTEKEKEG